MYGLTDFRTVLRQMAANLNLYFFAVVIMFYLLSIFMAGLGIYNIENI